LASSAVEFWWERNPIFAPPINCNKSK
jgi:hypothetical protein